MEHETPAAPAAPPAEELIDFNEFKRIKLRIGEITAAEAVPNSRKLVALQVNLGSDIGSRQVVAGIAQSYAPESLVGRRIVVVTNLKPAKLAGCESQGMLLAAVDDQHNVVLLQPEREIPAGSAVS